MDFLNCLELQQANKLISQSLDGITAAVETVELCSALGRITADQIIVPEDLPGYSRSTVDGFAVRSEDTFGASESAAALFSVTGEVLMGEESQQAISPGQAITIPTGGMMPCGADAVIMLENTERPDPHTLLAQKVVAPYENVVRKGEDVAAGAVVMEAGVRIAVRHVGLLAACGFAKIVVRRKLKVALLSTGDELVDIVETPRIGQVRDVNSYALAARLSELGCEVQRLGIVRDSFEHFFDQLSQAATNCQLLIISGGSSVGDRDFTVPAIQALGAPGLLIHGLAIKPGKPTIFGMAGKVPVFGLPGHPVAALIVCEQLVTAAIRKMYGMPPAHFSNRVPALLTRNLASVPGRDDFVTVRLIQRESGLEAEPLVGKSGLISLMNRADGILHIPAEKTGLYQNERVWVSLLDWKGE